MKTFRCLTILLQVLLCFLGVATLCAQTITFDSWQNLTTSGKLPAECVIQKSNNNLDLQKYNGRYYLAFRTAPTHFASAHTYLYIVSSTDLETWTFERSFHYGCDMREPRFAVYKDTLHFYFFTGGTNMFRFEPKKILHAFTTGRTTWSTAESISLDGYVPWRLRERTDTLYLSAYYGKNLYQNKHAGHLRLFYSTDAQKWYPVSTEPQIKTPTAEEGEFLFAKSGDLYATVRLEGTGAYVCRAPKNNIAQWETKRTKYKYDSALLFEHNDSVFLVARRNLDGPIDKKRSRKPGDEKTGRGRNLLRYSLTRKVTSLYYLDKNHLEVVPLFDFPSTGDCAFPGIAPIDSNTYLLFNYSSNIHGRKKAWIAGQLGRTYLYWTKLRF